MNRRGFLRTLAGGAAAAVAVRTFPFRAYSFPTTITNRLFWFGRIDTMNPAYWGGVDMMDHAPNVWFVNADQARAFELLDQKIEALELEEVRDELPTIYSNEQALYENTFYTDSIAGIRYHEAPKLAFDGLERSPYPGRLAPDQRVGSGSSFIAVSERLDLLSPKMIRRGSFTVTDVDHDRKEITVAAESSSIVKHANRALGDVFKEQDLVFRSIGERWRDFRNALKHA